MNDINYYMQICVCVRDRATERNAGLYVSVCVCVCKFIFIMLNFFDQSSYQLMKETVLSDGFTSWLNLRRTSHDSDWKSFVA